MTSLQHDLQTVNHVNMIILLHMQSMGLDFRFKPIVQFCI